MMMDPDLVCAAAEQALEDGMDRLEVLVEVLAPGGVAYDQRKLSDADFIAWWVDLGMRPDPAFTRQFPGLSTRAFLSQTSPDLYAEYEAHFNRLMGRKVLP